MVFDTSDDSEPFTELREFERSIHYEKRSKSEQNHELIRLNSDPLFKPILP